VDNLKVVISTKIRISYFLHVLIVERDVKNQRRDKAMEYQSMENQQHVKSGIGGRQIKDV